MYSLYQVSNLPSIVKHILKKNPYFSVVDFGVLFFFLLQTIFFPYCFFIPSLAKDMTYLAHIDDAVRVRVRSYKLLQGARRSSCISQLLFIGKPLLN